MNIILADASRKYSPRTNVDRAQLQKFAVSHRFYKPTMPVGELVGRIENLLKKNSEVGSRGRSHSQQYIRQESLEQLGLYLNKENNRQIFTLFQHILSHPKGITYDALSKKLKADIIAVSHYCCKLKKLRLISWEHEKQGVRVFPIGGEKKDLDQIRCTQYHHFRNEVSYDLKESFYFAQLGMNENIWINISGEEAMARGGLTNEQVKRKIMKHSQNKMVRRTVESMKFFEKNADRQGKVFEFKYKNETQQIKEQIARKVEIAHHRSEQDQIQSLDTSILEWLISKFPEFKGENFLLQLINNKFKDYLSILGVKQSKRQCTPLKLNRYIKVLNYIHREGGMRQADLRSLIVRDEAKFNVGIMHKRSLMGILQGLKGLGILTEEQNCYYPGWIEEENWVKRKEDLYKRMREEDDVIDLPRKKIHIDSITEGNTKVQKRTNRVNGVKRDTSKSIYNKISQKRYKFELFVAALFVNFQKAVNSCLKRGFNRIIYVQRKKSIQKYVPQLHILNLLDCEEQRPEINFNLKLQDFYEDLDQIVQQRGEKQQINIEIQNELIKFLRKNPSKSANSLRLKYGKNWKSKYVELQKQKIVEINEDSIRLLDYDRFLI